MTEKPRQPTSPTGWWIAGLLEQHTHLDRTTFWNNYRLIRASHWREAFRRAIELGTSSAETGQRAFGHPQSFIGITDLVPVYDEFEDGAEILWQEFDSTDCDSARLPPDVFTEPEMAAIYDA
jgi:hypothetical protein